MIYTLVCANGGAVDIITVNRLSLEQLQGLVGGLIEFTDAEYFSKDLPADASLCVNEEGLLLGLPMNKRFPMLAGNVVMGMDVATPDGREFQGLR
jgi:hypothetical protein